MEMYRIWFLLSHFLVFAEAHRTSSNNIFTGEEGVHGTYVLVWDGSCGSIYKG